DDGAADAVLPRHASRGLRLAPRRLAQRLPPAVASSLPGGAMGVVDRSKLGGYAEDQCAAYLERAGYQVRERNWLVREGELDIVAERGETLCFVEVRMRTSAVFGDPSLTVTREKQRRGGPGGPPRPPRSAP